MDRHPLDRRDSQSVAKVAGERRNQDTGGSLRPDTGSRQAAGTAFDAPGKKDTGSRAAVAGPSSDKSSKERPAIAAAMPGFHPRFFGRRTVRVNWFGLPSLARPRLLLSRRHLGVFLRGSGGDKVVFFRLTGHTGAVSSVAFSPNSVLIAAGSSDKSIMVWDPASGLLRQTLTGKSEPVYSIAFEPNGKNLRLGRKRRHHCHPRYR